MMSFGIALDDSTLISNGKDILLSVSPDKTTESKVNNMKVTERVGFKNGLNKQFEMFLKSHNGRCHHEAGISCTARIMARGKYDPMNIEKADIILNCIFHLELSSSVLPVIGDPENRIRKPMAERIVILELFKKLGVIGKEGRNNPF